MDFQMLYWHWLVIGMLLIIGEIFVASFTMFWFGLGAWWSPWRSDWHRSSP